MHEHHEHDFQYCKDCDVVWCKGCDKEWGFNSTWTPYPGTTTISCPSTDLPYILTGLSDDDCTQYISATDNYGDPEHIHAQS